MRQIPLPRKTLVDYAAIAVCPVLIMLLVGSLIFFLLAVGYSGAQLPQLRWTFFWFVLAMVLVSRIAIEKGSEHAAAYGLCLAGATAFMLVRYIGLHLWVFCLLGLIWWAANKLTWDCTLIDEEQDASGEGLLQATRLTLQEPVSAAVLSGVTPSKKPAPASKKPPRIPWWERGLGKVPASAKAPHAPGVWVIYFSLVALPVFGLGEGLLGRQDVFGRQYAFGLLLAYVAAALGLLLITSFLGLRRYLRQRYLIMPAAMAVAWLRTGALLALAILVGCVLLPRPAAYWSVATMLERLGDRSPDRGQRANRGNAPIPGAASERFSTNAVADGGPNGTVGQQRASESAAGAGTNGPAEPEPNTQEAGSKQQSGTANKPGPANGPADLGSPSVRFPAAQLLNLLRLAVYAVLLVLGIFLVIRNRARVWLALLQVLKALREFWRGSFSRSSKPNARGADTPQPKPSRPFAVLSNPFTSGAALQMPLPQLIVLSFNSLEAWAEEHGCGRQPDQTPFEFAARIAAEFPELAHEAQQVTALYVQVAYARGAQLPACLTTLEILWSKMKESTLSGTWTASVLSVALFALFELPGLLPAAEPAREPGRTSDRSFVIQQQYLNLPIKNAGEKRQLSVLLGDQVVREFEIQLADSTPDWWAFLDVGSFKGKTLTLRLSKSTGPAASLELVEQNNALKDAENLYREPLRPQFHFSSRRGWNNDPNGLVFYKGEYHLFYQHNPYGWSWGNMHWGHAVSTDLVHWTELPIALYPDEHGTIWSGSAVVDWDNSAGLQSGREKTLVALFTAAGKPFTQGLAYSNDRGRTWEKYAHNPVLPHVVGEDRDPKVIWYAPTKSWVMALYLEQDRYGLFGSTDLKIWNHLSDLHLPGSSECPEIFEIPVEGAGQERRWIFYGGNGGYLIGQFDGRTFTSESGPHALNFGNCFYASQTYNDIPRRDGRRVLIPWGQMAMPGMPFNQMMGLPVELRLWRKEAGALGLRALPVRELLSLRTDRKIWKDLPLGSGANPLADLKGELVEIKAELEPGTATELELNVRGIPVRYSVQNRELSCLDKRGPLVPSGGRIRLQLLVDRTSIDIFGNDGALYMPMGVIVPRENRAFDLQAKGGRARIARLETWHLTSAWPRH